MKDNKDNPADRIRQMSKELLAVANAIDSPMSVPDKVKRITDALGTGEMAHRLRVDPSTVISWRKGSRLLHSNQLKAQQLYDELFGNEE